MNLKEHFKAHLVRLIAEEEIQPEMPRVSWDDAIRGGLGGEGALMRLKGLYAQNMPPAEYAYRLDNLHDHLRDAGVPLDHPHMLEIKDMANDAQIEHERFERDKSESRAN
jgi:hypothetical protein